jgi:hypothetical protein
MSLWRDREFLKLWGGRTISGLGSQVTQVALPLTAVLVLHSTGWPARSWPAGWPGGSGWDASSSPRWSWPRRASS